MTFFLKEFDPASQPPRKGPDVRPTGFWAGVGAASSRMMRDTNANLQRQQEVGRETESVVGSAYPLLGEKAVMDRLKSKGMIPETQEALPADALRYNAKAKAEVMAMAREDAALNPDRWRDIDLTDEGVEARVTQRRKIEDEDEARTIEMMPWGQGAAELIGGMAGAMADIRQVPFMLVSGGGSLLSMMGRQAVANATAEAVTLPSSYQTAVELEKPDPNPLQQVAFGALGGAAFSAVFDGLPIALRRGFEYFQGRSQVQAPAGVDPVQHSAAVSAAEDALVKGEDPVQAAAAVADDWMMGTGPTVGNATEDDLFGGPAREPLIPDVQPRTDQDPIKKPQTDEELAQEAVDMLKATDDKRSRPLTAFIKRGQSDWKGIDPNGPFGQELKARGVNARTYPGLFRKGGRGDLDNLVASEMEENFPGISAAAGVDGLYLDRNGLLEVVIRDAQGDASWLQTRAALAQAEREAAQLENPTRPADDFVAGERADDGFFVNLDDYEFGGGDVAAAVGRDFDAYVTRKGITLLPRAREEILTELQARGGDAEYLVERALERELDDLEYLALRGEQTDGNSIGNGGGAPEGEPGPRAGALGQPQAGPGASAPDRAAGGQPAISERTAAGDQLLIAGVDPITERQRLEAAQQARLGGKPRGVDSEIGGLFDPGDKVRRDLFDDPAGPKAQPIQQAMAADMRDTVEIEGDFTVDLGDGPRSAKSLLDEMDGDDEFAAILDACGKPMVKE